MVKRDLLKINIYGLMSFFGVIKCNLFNCSLHMQAKAKAHGEMSLCE